MERFEKLGMQLMHRSDMTIEAVKDGAKRKLVGAAARAGLRGRLVHHPRSTRRAPTTSPTA